MFTTADLKKRVRQRPFVPFRVVTSSGETYEVVHPELILVGDRWLEIGTPTQRDPTVCDDVTRIARLRVTALEDLRPA